MSNGEENNFFNRNPEIIGISNPKNGNIDETLHGSEGSEVGNNDPNVVSVSNIATVRVSTTTNMTVEGELLENLQKEIVESFAKGINALTIPPNEKEGSIADMFDQILEKDEFLCPKMDAEDVWKYIVESPCVFVIGEYGWTTIVKLEILDYPQVIKKLMDLGTIRKRLDTNFYSNPVGFCY